jgi:hypothetical protein
MTAITRSVVLLAALIAAPSRSAAAQSPEPLLQELVSGESVFAQDRHEVQWTVAARTLVQSGSFLGAGRLALEFGLTDNWQVEAGTTSYFTNAGHGGTSLGVSGWALGSRFTSRGLLRGNLLLSVALEIGRDRDPSAVDVDHATDAELSAGALWRFERFGGAQLQLAGAVERGIETNEAAGSVDPSVALIIPVGAARFVVERGPATSFLAFPSERSASWSGGAGWEFRESFEVVVGGVARGGRAREFIMKLTHEY